MTSRRDRPPPPPLDVAGLERLALRYLERFMTTRGKLEEYLRRKLRERGWAGEAAADPGALAERMAELGYVDDRAFAEAKASSMARRGLGARRVGGALRQARVGEEELAELSVAIDGRALTSALAFARRKRIGPFAAAPAERDRREKQIAAMARAGHPFAIARQIVEASPGDTIGDADADTETNLAHCDGTEPC